MYVEDILRVHVNDDAVLEHQAPHLGLLQTALETVNEGVLITEEQGKVLLCNRRFLEIWGLAAPLESESLEEIKEGLAQRVRDPEAFLAGFECEKAQDPIELKDGRLIERICRVQELDGRGAGQLWTFRDITDLVKAGETRSRLAAVVESSDDAIVSKTLKGIIETWNKGAERVFGYTSDEVVGKSIEILIPAERLSEETYILDCIRRGVRIDHYETVRVRKDGERIDISLTVSPVRDSTGKIIGVSKIARDVTVRKRAEEAMRDENLILQMVYEIGQSITSQMNTERLVQVVTDTGRELTGAQFGAFFYNVQDGSGGHYTLHTLSGASKEDFENFGLPRNTPIFNPTFKGEGVVRSGDITQDSRYGQMAPHFGMPQGHLPVRSYLAVPVKSGSGEIIGGLFFGHAEANVFTERAERLIVAIAAQAAIALENARLFGAAQREINERTKAEEALRKSEEHLRAVFSQAAVGIAEANLEGNLTDMNAKFCEILGYERDELQNLTFLDITHPDHVEETTHQMAGLTSGEIPSTVYEKQYVRKDGSAVWCLTTVTMLKDAAGRPRQFVGVIEDISLRKQAEESRQHVLESERAARQQAEKLSQLKDEFLATLSHELRTPLNAIVGWSHLIGKHSEDTGMVNEGISVIERNAKLQAQLVADLLDMSRVNSGKMRLDVQLVQLPVIVEAALDSVRPAADAKGIKLQAILDPIPEPVHGDPGRLQQVVWNLLSNAVKFTPKKGKVQVVLHRINSHVEIAVSDTGSGIRPDFLPRLFERFSQQDSSAARKHGGLGIGLALVKQLTELHGGKVRAHSEGEGLGATFVVELPLSVARHPAIPEERVHPTVSEGTYEGDLPDLSGRTVLVVDDEADTRKMLQRILEDVGANVETVGSGDEAMQALQEREFDVLVSDIGMPKLDGYELIKQLRYSGFTIPAIALTAFARSTDRTRALLAGFNSHVSKPVEPSELLATIAALVRGQG